MRVGLVCPYDMSRPGGVQAQVRGLASALTEMGDEPTVFAPGLSGVMEGVDLGSTVSIPGNGSMAPISVNPLVGSRLRREARDMDLLHVHEPLMPMVSLAALRAGPPIVATFHAAPRGLAATVYSLFGNRLERLLGGNVAAVTAVSETAASPLPDTLDVQIVPNGVDTNAFDLDVPRVPTRVCFLGRDERRKGLDVLIEAWGKVAEDHPDAELVVIGIDRGITGVTWFGSVDDHTKNETLASSAIYVAPNLGGESFGIVLVEAMAAGAALLVSDLDSFRDVAGEAARYFTVGDSRALAASLTTLLSNPAEVSAMSVEGRHRAERFDWNVVAASYRTVYEEALS